MIHLCINKEAHDVPRGCITLCGADTAHTLYSTARIRIENVDCPECLFRPALVQWPTLSLPIQTEGYCDE
jgi:hypothetical protein